MGKRVTLPRVAVLLGLAIALAVVAAQAASGAGAVIVRGDQLVAGSENCLDDPASLATYSMAGDLVGCWYTDTFDVTHQKDNAGGSYKASGTEHFVGCLDMNRDDSCDGPKGVFRTTFTFTAKYAPTGEEVHGRCQHPIVGGTGAFAGASGVISFKDIPPEGRFPYHGNIQL